MQVLTDHHQNHIILVQFLELDLLIGLVQRMMIYGETQLIQKMLGSDLVLKIGTYLQQKNGVDYLKRGVSIDDEMIHYVQ
jgi:hypothetical protein